MRKSALTAALFVLLASPAVAGGGVGLMVSYWSTDEADAEVGLGAMLEFDLGEAVDIELRFAQVEGLGWPEDTPVIDLDAFPIDLGLSYNFDTGGRATPYVGGGASYVLFDSSVGHVDDEIGYYVLAGVQVEASRVWDVFFEVYYRDVDADIQGSGIAQFVEIPVDFAGPAANFGVAFGW